MPVHLLQAARIVLLVGALLYASNALATAWDARLIVPFFDEWDFLAWYRDASTSGVTFTGLWAPHNGHRLLVPRLLFFLRDSMLGGGPEFLILLSMALQAGLIGMIVNIICREPRLLGTALQSLLVAATIVVMTWTVQMENFHWGIQVTYVLSAFLAVAAITLLCCFPRRNAVDGPVLAASAVAMLSCLCLGAGLGAWPAMMAVAIAQRRGAQAIGVIATGSVLCAPFFLGIGATSLTTAVADPVGVLRFMCRYLGPPFIREGYAVLLGASMIGLGVIVIGIEQLRGISGRLANLALGLITFGLSVALLTAIARSGEPLAYGRYVAFSSIYWVGLMLTVGLLATMTFSGRVRLVFSAAVVAALVRFPLATETAAARLFVDRADQSTAAVLSMLAGTPDEEAIAAHLHPRPQVPLQLLPFLVKRGYGFFGGRLARTVGHAATDEFQMGKEFCRATISVAARRAGMRLSGSFDGATAPAWLVVVDRGGLIRGLAVRARGGSEIAGYAPAGALGGTLYGVEGNTLCRAASVAMSPRRAVERRFDRGHDARRGSQRPDGERIPSATAEPTRLHPRYAFGADGASR